MAAILDNTRRGGAGRAVVDNKMAKRGEGAGGAKRNSPFPSPSLDFCSRPLVPGSARLKYPRWRPISEWVAMKPQQTASKQAIADVVILLLKFSLSFMTMICQ